MQTKRILGMIAMVAAVSLGVVGVDRWTKDAKARTVETSPVAAAETLRPSLPSGVTTIHYQVDPSEPPLPPVPLPMETKAPPLISTGELEKQLKESLDNLQKNLPKLPSAEESTLPPPEPVKGDADNKQLPSLPEPVKGDAVNKSLPSLPEIPPPGDSKAAPVKPLPPVTNISVPVSDERPSPPALPKLPPVETPSLNVTSGAPPKALDVPSVPKPSTSLNEVAPLPIAPQKTADPGVIRNISANIPATEDLQKRLTDLEVKYLKDTIVELERRVQQMPKDDADRRRLEQDHQRLNDRLARLMKAAEWNLTRRVDDAVGKTGQVESPWTMNLETVDGKTVLQAVVHRKARFKIVCERLDLQTPRGTLLAVGQVQISGEGFQGTCQRLSIPLHQDRLILEGSAEVGVRTQAMSIIDERKEGVPPLIEPRRVDEQASAPVPILHLKGDYLDLRWSDLQPAAAGSAKIEGASLPKLQSSSGPMVKVAFSSARNEQWSEWGTLRRTLLEKDGRPVYVLEDRQSKPLVFVHTPAGMSLTEYVGKRVSVFGLPIREDGRPALTFTASHVAWE